LIPFFDPFFVEPERQKIDRPVERSVTQHSIPKEGPVYDGWHPRLKFSSMPESLNDVHDLSGGKRAARTG
jgi:hypothetical protein